MRSLIAACLLLPGSLLAADAVSHDYFEVQGAWLDPEDVDAEAGVRVRGSLQLVGNFLVYGDYTRAGFDAGGADVDVDIANLGVGYRVRISEASDVSFQAGAIRTSADAGVVNVDDTGALVAMEVRSRFDNGVELGTRAGWTHDGPDGNGYLLAMNVLYHFNEWLAVSAEALTYDGDVNHYGAGLRVSF